MDAWQTSTDEARQTTKENMEFTKKQIKELMLELKERKEERRKIENRKTLKRRAKEAKENK